MKRRSELELARWEDRVTGWIAIAGFALICPAAILLPVWWALAGVLGSLALAVASGWIGIAHATPRLHRAEHGGLGGSAR